MTFCLDSVQIKPEKNKEIGNAIILLHGYGGDGKDISMLSLNWKRHLPNTIFICPNGHEQCSINPSGFQWFDLMDESEDKIFSKSLIAEQKLNSYIDEIIEKYKIENEKIALVGFSQGCMISLQVALKRKKKISCVIGYSGKILNKDHLKKNINSRPKIYLMHGDKDGVVPINSLLEAKHFFEENKYEIYSKIFKNCEHRIPNEGVSIGLDFLKKNL